MPSNPDRPFLVGSPVPFFPLPLLLVMIYFPDLAGREEHGYEIKDRNHGKRQPQFTKNFKVVNIRTSDMIVIVGGRSGTLGEFSIVYNEGKLIGVLLGTGGITVELKRIVQLIRKKTRARIIDDRNPERLIKRLLTYDHSKHFKNPSCFHQG
jgi:hypothetical protein